MELGMNAAVQSSNLFIVINGCLCLLLGLGHTGPELLDNTEAKRTSDTWRSAGLSLLQCVKNSCHCH